MFAYYTCGWEMICLSTLEGPPTTVLCSLFTFGEAKKRFSIDRPLSLLNVDIRPVVPIMGVKINLRRNEMIIWVAKNKKTHSATRPLRRHLLFILYHLRTTNHPQRKGIV